MPNGTTPTPAPNRPAPPSATAPAAAATPATPATPATTAADVPPPSCNCGQLAPLPGESPLALGTPSDAIVSQIQLECDNETGVFFFRFKGRLYLRVVKVV